jgi:hypothetical protein
MSTGSLHDLQESQMVSPNSCFCVGRPHSTQFDVHRSRITQVTPFKVGRIPSVDDFQYSENAGSTNDFISFQTMVLNPIAEKYVAP